MSKTNTTYRVMYLDRAKPKVQSKGLGRAAAEAQMRYLKRRGLTTWVETDGGRFVPVKGAMRKPAHL